MILKNDYIQITIDKKGAELKGIYSLEANQDIMWHGDEAWWGKVSPLLFPFVGTSKNHQYTYDGKTYDMKPHGFIGERDFLIESVDQEEVWFSYTSTDEDYDIYPFKFRIKVGYKLEWSKVHVNWVVENLDEKDMIYTIGAHPSFLFEEGDAIIYQTKDGDVHSYSLKGPHILDKEKVEIQRLTLNDDAFPVDTWIYDGIKSATLLNVKKGSSIKLEFEDFEFVGIWSPMKNGKVGPFVCIEPWNGLPDFADASGELTEKKTATVLAPKSENAYSYSIEIA